MQSNRTESRTRRTMERNTRRRLFAWMAEFVGLLGFWLLYVGQIAATEIAVGLAAAALVTGIADNLRGRGFAKFWPRTRWVLQIRYFPQMILSGCWVLVKVLVLRTIASREIHGQLSTVPFKAGGAQSRSAARRALAITFTTMAPNFIVVGIDPQNDLLLYHQILASEVPTVTKNLGAG